MTVQKNADFDRTDLGTIDHLISHFEKRRITAFSRNVPVEDYNADCEHRRLLNRLGGAISSPKELRDNLEASEK